MRLILPAAVATLAAAAITAPGAAGAGMTCKTSSENVIRNPVVGKLTASNVDPSQKRYATCAAAKKVMDEMLSLRIEMSKAYEGFRCTPSVTSTGPDVVDHRCLFKGADTGTLIRLAFTARYDDD